MANFVKWIGGGVGFYVGGPTGGLLGFLLGSFFDEAITTTYSTSFKQPSIGTFGMNLLVLTASVMNADGKVVKAELDYVKQFFVRQFGENAAKEAIGLLKDLLKQDIQIRDACMGVRMNLDYASRIRLLHFMFNLAAADKIIEPSEIHIVELIADYLGITSQDHHSIKNLYIVKTDSSYKILEIDPSISNDEVKKAYRKLAMRYHPDKVSHLGEDKRKAADDKFKRVNEAYEIIKKERNMV
jgi:DnaJ like chaperone protein